MALQAHLSQEQQRALQHFCHKHHIKRLAFFGSVLTDTFHAGSDIDILVEFLDGHTPGYRFFSMQNELEKILGRAVDLTTSQGLHPMIQAKVLRTAQTYYEHS
jgi:predicted nucleotidyltransferase